MASLAEGGASKGGTVTRSPEEEHGRKELNIQLKEKTREKQKQPEETREKEAQQIRTEINEIEKISKIHKPLANLINKVRGRCKSAEHRTRKRKQLYEQQRFSEMKPSI